MKHALSTISVALVAPFAGEHFRAANEEAPDVTKLRGVVGEPLTAVNDDTAVEQWLDLPFSESTWTHPKRKKTYRQIFGKAEAQALVRAHNSILDKARRLFFDPPIFLGHPDVDPDRYPRHDPLGTVKDMQVGETGLRLLVAWNEAGLANKTAPEGERRRFPSPVWDMAALGDAARPYRLVSIGMTNTPNIKAVKAWNDADPGIDEWEPIRSENETMNLIQQIKAALIEAGIIKEGDSDDAIASGVASLLNTITYARREKAELEARLSSLKAANDEADAKAAEAVARAEKAESDLTAANERVSTLGSEVEAHRATTAATRELVTAANERIGAAVAALVDRAVEAGAIPVAEREERLRAFNEDFSAALAALPAKNTALNTGGLPPFRENRVRAANEAAGRAHQREQLLAAKMKQLGSDDRTAAWRACAADNPELFDTRPKAEA